MSRSLSDSPHPSAPHPLRPQRPWSPPSEASSLTSEESGLLSPDFTWQPSDNDGFLGCDLDESVRRPRTDAVGPSGSVKLENRGATSHAQQEELWSPRHHFRVTISAKLREAGLTEQAEALEECHTVTSYAVCIGCRKAREFRNRCDRSYCPCCQPRLATERKRSIEWWTQRIDQPKHVVLTLKNTPTLSRDHVQHLKESFARLRRTKFARGWRGGFYSIEVTNEGRGWHLHLHALVDCPFIPADRLAIEWDKANRGLGHIVRVKDCRDRAYLQEVTKYAVKGSELAGWTALDVADFVRTFERCRTFGVFGSLYGKRTEWREWLDSIQEEKAPCPCGCSDVEILSESEWKWEQTTRGPPAPTPCPQCLPSAPPQLDFALPVAARFTLPD